jgi:hypothetical protein
MIAQGSPMLSFSIHNLEQKSWLKRCNRMLNYGMICYGLPVVLWNSLNAHTMLSTMRLHWMVLQSYKADKLEVTLFYRQAIG